MNLEALVGVPWRSDYEDMGNHITTALMEDIKATVRFNIKAIFSVKGISIFKIYIKGSLTRVRKRHYWMSWYYSTGNWWIQNISKLGK